MALLFRAGLGLVALAAWQVVAAPPPPTAAPAPAVTPAPASASPAMSLAALKLLQPGLWQIEARGRAPKQMCLTDTTALVQIEHDQPGCSRFVIANDPRMSTVHYSCQRAGWGRTTIRVETEERAAIQTQGIARNAPFDYSVDARRIGACSGQVPPKH